MTEDIGSNSKCLLPYDRLPEGVQNRLDFIFNRFHNLRKRWVSESPNMRDFNINMQQRLALEMLCAAKQGLPQHVLAGHLNMSPTATVLLIDRLEARCLVDRKENPANRRENLVFFTEDYGGKFVERMLSTIDAKTEDVHAALPDDGLREFMRLAGLLIAQMEKENCSNVAEFNEVANA